jgi:peptidoglycan/xylan/chitin deacetylase (PgdA/CDA1 family)
MRISQGQYGARQGVPRIRALLARHEIKASFFYPAVSALLHPDEMRGVADEGQFEIVHEECEAHFELPRGRVPFHLTVGLVNRMSPQSCGGKSEGEKDQNKTKHAFRGCRRRLESQCGPPGEPSLAKPGPSP